ncbi:MAG: LysM peptidoglycan-binding domain-containing protein [Verrucomicrobiaceae bacterium]
MKATTLILLPLGFLVSCTQFTSPPPAAPPAAPAMANPYGVPGVDPYQAPDAGAYTPEASAPYQPINPPAAAAPYAPAPAPFAPTPSSGATHTVVKGDSLWGISRQYHVSIDDLRQANNIQGDTIILGSTLNIPAR